ncbi:SIR2 family protein [Sodalis sp. dw_96]|uniref:SIR2 family protein n=1 Tax=Sodalis sp. dw_96 TaxID=2719794 RepID=UPI001BD2FFE5|nr:SIR2 family protein [Sodalis sp. dw_96]
MKLLDLEKTIPYKKRTIKDLANYVKAKSGNSPNYSLFLGAGASVTSGIQSGTQLVDEWRKEVYELLSGDASSDEKKAKDYLRENESTWYDSSNEYSSLFEKVFDLPSQRRRFVEQQVDGKLPSIGYSYLVSLFQSGFFDTVFTTNFDDLINEAFYQFSRERPSQWAHDSSIRGLSVNSSRPKIIKLHGDYLFDSIKSTLNETESLEINTKDKLIEFAKKYGLIFMGYAGNDRSIMTVVDHLLRQEEYLVNGIYWCLRDEDEINSDLIKILQKERVYYIEIQGFDQALAELHFYIKGEGLSLDANFKTSKRDIILNNFTQDSFSLSTNKFISEDISKLRSHTNKLDISNLINELSQDKYIDGETFTEIDFRNLLSIDNLIKHNKYDDAEQEAEKNIIICDNENLRRTYISRLVSIYKIKEQYEKALIQVDKLIEMDEFSPRNHLLKSTLFINTSDRYEYISSILEKFKYNSSIRNEFASAGLSYIESKHPPKEPPINKILTELDISLTIDPSLDNRAWHIKERALRKRNLLVINDKEYKESMEVMLEKMASINPHDEDYLALRINFIKFEKTLQKTMEIITELNNIYLLSSSYKKTTILHLLLDIHSSMSNLKLKDENIKANMALFERYSKEFSLENDATLLIFSAEHFLSFDHDLKQAKQYAVKSLDAKNFEECASKILEILMFDTIDEINCEKLLEKTKDAISEKTWLMLKWKYLVELGRYEDSYIILDKALSLGIEYQDYLVNLTYAYLREGAYQKVINLLNINRNDYEDIHSKNILIINKELANKSLNNKINKTALMNAIGIDNKSAVSVCAHIILNEEIPARRLIDDIINNDYSFYYTFKQWPAIPNSYLSKYENNYVGKLAESA